MRNSALAVGDKVVFDKTTNPQRQLIVEDFEKRFGKGPHTVARIIVASSKPERPWVYLEANSDLGFSLDGPNWFATPPKKETRARRTV
jgi:hypothetical protein